MDRLKLEMDHDKQRPKVFADVLDISPTLVINIKSKKMTRGDYDYISLSARRHKMKLGKILVKRVKKM